MTAPVKLRLRVFVVVRGIFSGTGQTYRRTCRSEAVRRTFADWQRFSDFRREAAHLELRLRRSPNDLSLLRRMAQLIAAYGKPELAEGYRHQIRDLEDSTPGPGMSATEDRRRRQKGGD